MSSRIREPWSGRKARMKCQHSRMEQMLLIEFSLLRMDVEIDVPVELTPTVNGRRRATTPDFMFNKRTIAVYVDGIPHRRPRRIDRDEAITKELVENHHLRVIRVGYDHYSGKEVERLRDEILQELDQ